MIDVQWAQTRSGRSWHILRWPADREWKAKALCGRKLDSETLADERPGNEKTCESCLRIGGPR